VVRPERVTALGLAVSLVLLALIGVQSFRQIKRVASAARDVELESSVIAHVERLVSYVKDAETGQRGFLITGEDGYLAPYRKARAGVFEQETILRELTAGDAEQQQRLDGLEHLITARLAELRNTIDLSRQSGFGAARRMIRKDRGKHLMDAIRDTAGRMVEAEAALVDERQHTRTAASELSARSVGFASALAFALLAAATIALQRNAGKRERALADLRAARAETEASAREQARSLALLETFMKGAPVGMAFTDAEFRFVHVNDAIAAINGVPAKEHIGRTVEEVVPQFWPVVGPRYRRIMETGEAIVGMEVSGFAASVPGDRRHWLVS